MLLDTNILTRCAEPGHAMYQVATGAVAVLRTNGHRLCLVPQNFYEFWAVATRPLTANGLGKSAAEAAADLAALRSLFTVLDDTPAVFPEWERLVTSLSVVGKNAYDARLVAAMIVHGESKILTFNDHDFRRFPGITALTPAAVLAAPPAP
ncbi:MAG TPA: type II toxin-antitoxin system VapC family toxin [Gemmataceae bacterium]